MQTKRNNHLITVAMVTYNSEDYVRVAIDSVLASDYENFELIICDDCSSDSTWEYISSYDDKRIRKFKNKSNIGEYPNRNRCIELAKGEYFIFVDGDDYLYPFALNRFLAGSRINSDAAMIISRPQSYHMIYPVSLKPKEVFKYDYLGQGITSEQGFPSTMFKTSYLKIHKLNTSYISGDTYIKRVLGYNYDTILISTGLAWWRRTPGQASEKSLNTIQGLLQNYKISYLLLDKFGNQYLNRQEMINSRKRISKSMVRIMIKSFLKFRWHEAYAIMRTLKLKAYTFQCIFYRHKDMYRIADSKNPLNSLNS